MIDSLEKIPVEIFSSPKKGSEYVARIIADLIKEKNALGNYAVIGLATGSTPKSLYAELVKLHQQEGLSFKKVITFNLDQYYPMEPDALNSYHYFMRKYLFEQTDIDPENYFLPNGLIPKEKIKQYRPFPGCWYQQADLSFS